ncbi:MAG: hypothetical protein ACLFR1_10070 [Spirochaetia bacterium]
MKIRIAGRFLNAYIYQSREHYTKALTILVFNISLFFIGWGYFVLNLLLMKDTVTSIIILTGILLDSASLFLLIKGRYRMSENFTILLFACVMLALAITGVYLDDREASIITRNLLVVFIVAVLFGETLREFIISVLAVIVLLTVHFPAVAPANLLESGKLISSTKGIPLKTHPRHFRRSQNPFQQYRKHQKTTLNSSRFWLKTQRPVKSG